MLYVNYSTVEYVLYDQRVTAYHPYEYGLRYRVRTKKVQAQATFIVEESFTRSSIRLKDNNNNNNNNNTTQYVLN